jgi:type IV pilus assembly protein PilN
MTPPLFTEPQDLLRQRRLERGLPPEPPPLAPARRLLLLGSLIGTAAIGFVLAGWSLILLRNQMVIAEVGRMSGVPGQLEALEGELRNEKGQLDQQTKSNEALAGGLVALSSGSALMAQLAQLTPQGVQLTEASVAGPSLSLKGHADDPGALTRVNTLGLLLAYAPLFKSDGVRVLKITREDAGASPAGRSPGMAWELNAVLAALKPSQQLPLLRRLGAEGMAARLQDLARTGVLP